jgi:hypothetical protein
VSLSVETGFGVITADAYVSAADCAAYAANRGLTFAADASADSAIRRATSYIDNTYRLRFAGYRTFRRLQGLEWPRTGAFYQYPDNVASPYLYGAGVDGSQYGYAAWPFDPIGINTVPPEIITATCEAAIREYADPGVLQPDLDRGGAVSLLKAGSVEVKYAAGAPAQTVFQIIDAALSGLIGVQSAYSARAVRG